MVKAAAKKNEIIKSKVAIITRTKDRPIMLKRAIEDVLKQKYKDWVHVIVDAGKPHVTKALVARYKSKYAGRVKVVYSDAGMTAASNVGLAHCLSDYVVIHDDDDSWDPNFLVKMLSAFKKPPLGKPVRGVVCHSHRIEEKIMKDGKIKRMGSSPFNTWLRTLDIARLCASNTFPPISFLFERSLIDEVGHFDEYLPGLDDWDFNLRACLVAEIMILPEPLAFYHSRVGEKSIYLNSTYEDKHYLHRSRLINHWIRTEYKAGRFSIAQTMTTCELNCETHRSSQRVNRFLDRITTPV